MQPADSKQASDQAKPTPVIVQDFKKDTFLPKVWVVNIPDDHASVQLSSDHPFEGKRCLKLHYQFTGNGQYLGVPIPVKIRTPIHKVRLRLYGDNSGSGYGLRVDDATNEVHKYRNAGTMKIDFTGWKEIVFDLDTPHEIWGGNRNGKIDYPITMFTIEISQSDRLPVKGDIYFDALSVESERPAEEMLGSQISIITPAYCSDVRGETARCSGGPRV